VLHFIAAFEDELVRIWNKPKFVLRSGYVITLDRIMAVGAQHAVRLLKRLIEHPGFAKQVEEWQELEMVDKSFKADALWETNLTEGRHLHPRYRFLPIDTRYFKDLELEILALFDNLDEALDGWLVKSENYQALNTMLKKFRERVQTIYIDPPFNKEQDADYFYSVKYKDSIWATMLENRLRLAKDLLSDRGSIFVRCDYNGNWIVRCLMDEIFGKENFRNEVIVNRSFRPTEQINRFHTAHDSLYLYSRTERYSFVGAQREREMPKWRPMHLPGVRWSQVDPEYVHLFSRENLKERKGKVVTRARIIMGREMLPPEGRHWALNQKEIFRMEQEGKIKLDENGNPLALESPYQKVTDNWTDITGYSSSWNFPTENSEILLKRVIESTSSEGDLVLDFFLGSGTTIAVAHKLKRKWIGVEMGEHFWTVVFPRMKKVLFYDRSGISKEKDVKENYNERNAGGFFKYYELEQYEDTLSRTRYLDDNLFTPPPTEDPCQYLFLRDPKMLEALEVNLEQGTVKVDLSKLYPDIDLAETLSNLTGKWIKRIHPDPEDCTKPGAVEFADGTKADLKNPDWRLIKPLIWW